MDDATKRRLKEIEGRVDADYVDSFSRLPSWEAGAVSLLMAHECAMLGSAPQLAADRYKYTLMHALRFGKDSPSRPNWSVPARLDAPTLSNARDCLDRAHEYVGICGAFWRGFNGLVSVQIRGDNRVEFGKNPEWSAFDVLDGTLSDECCDRELSQRIDYAIQKAARKSKVHSRGNAIASEIYSPDFETLKHAVPLFAAAGRRSSLLPNDWVFRGVPIQDFRSFWHALWAIARLHSRVVRNAFPPPALPTSRLLTCSREGLLRWICHIVDIDPLRAKTILDYHVYDRSGKTPDIAITPFLPVGNDVLVAAPSIIWSSSLERNLCAHLGRTLGDEFATSTAQCASSMGDELCERFRSRDFLATTQFNIDSTDIDLLVYAPAEQFLFSAELRWLVPPADVAEGIQRGEKECLKKLSQQLPKHQQVLSADAGRLASRAFGLPSDCAVKSSGSMLIVRGYVGTPRMRIDPFAFCDDRILLRQLAICESLSHLLNWCREMPYLPVLDRDYQIGREEVTTPSGIHIVHHESLRFRTPPCNHNE